MKPTAMTPGQQKAIAEACGWTGIEARIVSNGESRITGKPPGQRQPRVLPDYLNDLNAMHEAENIIFNRNEWLKYTDILLDIQPKDQSPIRATAAQRVEAFLKVIGKWKE